MEKVAKAHMANYDNEQEQERGDTNLPNEANRIVDGIKNHAGRHSSPDKSSDTGSANSHIGSGTKKNPEIQNQPQADGAKAASEGKAGTSQIANQAKDMGQTAGRASAAGGTGAATAAGGTAASSAGGTAAGAAAGSIAPGIGTAIGAAAGKTADSAKKAKEASDAANNVEIKGKGGGGFEASKDPTVADTNFVLKIVIGIISVCAALVISVMILCSMMIGAVAAPIMAVFKLAEAGYTAITGFFGNDASFEDIQAVFVADMQDAFSDAYTDVCQDEVYQIAIEQEYDIDLTMASYNNTRFPYILSGDGCNVNYAEIFNVISLADHFDFDDWKHFDYDSFRELYEDKEFLRTLYTLRVERAEKYIINEAMLAEGESCTVHQDKSVTITHADGSTSSYTGEAAKAYYEVIIYGEVSVSAYGLLELFDYFELDPYAASEILPNMTNWKAMEYQEYFTRCYNPDVFWGNEERSKLIPYEHQTGELVEDAGGMYIKDIFDSMVITEDYVYFDVVEYKQADPRWGPAKYLGHSMASYGCCVTSMAMVINYYGSSSINPGNLLDKMNKEYSGSLNRPALSEQFGFWHYLDDNSFSLHSDLTKITGALSNEQLVMAHIRPNSSEHFSTKNGHWIVLHGYQRAAYDGNSNYSAMVSDGSPGFFYVNDPNRNNEIMTFMEAANLIDRIQSYGYR